MISKNHIAPLLALVFFSSIFTAKASLNDGLVAWYPLDGNGTDQSATANHATVHGATPTADRHGLAGKALLFGGSGSNHYLQAPFSQAISSSTFSYSVWAKPTSTTNNYGSPITFRADGRGFNLYKMPDNTWSYWTGNGGWQKFHAQPISLNWTALAFTHDGITGKGYQNGVLVVSSNKPYLSALSGQLRIGTGSGTNGPTYFFNGAIDETRIWNRVLSPVEISDLYAIDSQVPDSMSDFNTTAPLVILENQSIGAIVGEFNATDPNSTTPFTFVLEASTSNATYSDSNGEVTVSFFVNGSWTSNASFFSTTNQGELKSNTFTTAAKPTKLKFSASSDDAWGYWRINFAGTTILQDPNGAAGSPTGSAPYWVDGDQDEGMPVTQIHDLPAHAYSYSLVSGSGSTGNSLFSLNPNGTLSSSTSFDYESNATHHIRVQATNELNASLVRIFTVSVTDQVEDDVVYLFNTAGATGRIGPTQSQIDSNYGGSTLAGSVTINTQGIQEWTVPATGAYKIEAYGAAGGDSGSNGNGDGGSGAVMKGLFTFQAGQTIRVIVGQRGLSAPYEAGGGGGTFVFHEAADSLPLIVAGGGGGGGRSSDGKNAGTSTDASSGEGSNNGSAGSTGHGGSKSNHSSYAGAGGAGWLSDGQNGVDTRSASYMSASGGLAPRNGAVGGNNGTNHNPFGGFGGGGAGRGHNYAGAGGGGGYTGGGAGAQSGSHGGGAGGSYNSGSDQNNTAGGNDGPGKVVITQLSGSSGPSSQPPTISQGTGPLSKTILEDSTATWLASELNATDSDTSASSLSWSLVSGPANGIAQVDGNGSSPTNLSYQPNSNFHGTDSFVVRVSDGDKNDSILLNLTITPVNDHTVVTGDLNANLNEDSSIQGDLNATDPDGMSDGTYFLITNQPAHGSAAIHQATGIWTYQPNQHFHGSDSFNLSVTDDTGQTTSVTINLIVQPQGDPTAVTGDLNASLNEDSSIQGDLNATDPDGMSDGTYFLITNQPAHGSAAIHQATGIWTYQPNQHFHGSDSFNLLVTDDTNQTAGVIINLTISSVNDAPNTLDLNASSLPENQPSGFPVGRLSASDPDQNDSILFTLAEGNGSTHNTLFLVDANGTLRTQTPLDFENASSLSIRIRATDQQNDSIERTFSIQVTNQVEDLDGDGLEDHYDLDDDADGFPDSVETAYGSDPRNAQSVANAAPVSLDLNGSSILENLPVGSLVGQLTARDGDANATLSFSLVDGNGSEDNHLFSIDALAKLRTRAVFDYEANAIPSAAFSSPNDRNATPPFLASSPPTSDHNTNLASSLQPDRNASSTVFVERNGTGTPNSPSASISNTNRSAPIASEQNPAPSLSDFNASRRAAGVLDFQSGPTRLRIRIRVTDEHNASLEKAFLIDLLNEVEDFDGDGIEDAFDPDDVIYVMPTLEAVSVTVGVNGRVSFLSGFRPRPEFSLPAFAFQVSTGSDFNDSLLTQSAIVEGNRLLGSLYQLKPGQAYHVRVLATHRLRSLSGESTRFEIPIVISNWWEKSETGTGDWRTSPWLGTFLPHPSGWIHHAQMDWLYAHGGAQGDLWLWNNKLGWLWTTEDVFPHLFGNSSSNWFYFLKKRDGIPLFYDYSTEQVRSAK